MVSWYVKYKYEEALVLLYEMQWIGVVSKYDEIIFNTNDAS